MVKDSCRACFRTWKPYRHIKKARLHGPKKDPVWVYLEQQMREMDAKGIKPYNQKVGNWLVFLRDLRYFFHSQRKRKLEQLRKIIGPPWYFELSPYQKDLLKSFQNKIHEDLYNKCPYRMKVALRKLGIETHFPAQMLLDAEISSVTDDPGLFLWNLYTAYYGYPPCQPMPEYDMTAKLIMSSIAYIDNDECIAELEKHCQYKPPPQIEETLKVREKGVGKNKYYEPKIKYGQYLQKLHVPCVLPDLNTTKEKEPDPLPVTRMKRLMPEHYEQIAIKNAPLAIQARIDRDIAGRAKFITPVCKYKFWEPPLIDKNDPQQYAIAIKMKMFKMRPRKKALMNTSPNQVPIIGSVSYSAGRPYYILNGITNIKTGYIVHNGGKVRVGKEYITLTLGHYLYPKEYVLKCEARCDCLKMWGEQSLSHAANSVCKCHHWFDFNHEGPPKERYFHRPTRHGPYWFDYAKVYQFYPWEDFIKDEVAAALRSSASSSSTHGATRLKPWEYLRQFFADLSKTPLLTPHLPKAYLLNNLCEWVRNRVYGKITPNEHKRLLLKSARNWLDLDKANFHTRAYFIPFTPDELKCFNYSHRVMLGKLANKLYDNFERRLTMKQIEKAQLLLATMNHYLYYSKNFTDTFFSYMPTRLHDITILGPHKPGLHVVTRRPCPLKSPDRL